MINVYECYCTFLDLEKNSNGLVANTKKTVFMLLNKGKNNLSPTSIRVGMISLNKKNQPSCWACKLKTPNAGSNISLVKEV